MQEFEEETNYIVIDFNSDKRKRAGDWGLAFGIQKPDGLEPTEFSKGVSEEHINGEVTIGQAEDLIERHHKKITPQSINEYKRKKRECDLVAVRIVKILGDGTFGFSPVTLKSIHKALFEDIYDFAGEYRKENIVKKEKILYGDTVRYVNYQSLEDYLQYDFHEEERTDYSEIGTEKWIDHISEFTSDIWQIHPFREGNTRTIAVFIEKYLNHLGFNVNNDMFKENSVYFRNSLVRSNYAYLPKGIYPTRKYLNMFFENLLLGKNHELRNEDLYVEELKDDVEHRNFVENFLKDSRKEEVKNVKRDFDDDAR